MRIHKVHQLHKERLARSTKPFNARGANVNRCEYCQVHKDYCICEHQPDVQSNAAFLLIMFDTEVLKPSNTGKLIADLIPETHAYLWSRTEPNPEMLALLQDDSYQPFVIFPEEQIENKALVTNDIVVAEGKTPLFILLDGSWREAGRMYRKSVYLHQLPVLSFNSEHLSSYIMRKASKDHQLATAEVASLVLDLFGEKENAKHLECWFELFREHYLYSKRPVKGAERGMGLKRLVDFRTELKESNQI
ncbi:DTW domain-containing protein [Aliivibrio finisterrensis]|uniref:tRNA-uridine aminocarboxypropyltransferase n=1 Tax=Aliivibrio finisterrensis TaxID=511998 RepID=A0A4Q5KJI1_9GAMM|nr:MULTISPECIES: tRNA-uridine aminocarboxypropyltransferase [Aliivibrio]MDD9173927.1 DTW domain-containing protein [Aliivibrio sp. S3TY1]MDD9191004.1 DTW domain-containing protein [Aliivibrio sp. S2TY2]RYU46420.1 DTW domain-containing protein [Aliivibrio finisterrensis]